MRASALARGLGAGSTAGHWIRNVAAPTAVALVSGTVYASTLLPTVGYAGDVAKFQFVGHVLGTPHAPGYPLYTGISFAFTRALAFGSVAWRANLLSALFAVAALLLLYALLRRFGCGRWVAAPVAIAAGLLPAFWSQAVIAEVYTLHVLLVAAVFLLLARWQDGGRRRDLIAGLATLSLGFAHHLAIVVLVPGVLAFIARVDRPTLRLRRVGSLLPLALVGVAPYGYLFWRTAQPRTSYLEIQTPDFATWWWYLTGAQFRERIFAFNPVEMLTDRLPQVADLALGQLVSPRGGWPGASFPAAALVLVAILVGVGTLGNAARHLLLAGTLAGNVIYVLGYDIPDIAAYLLPTYVVLALYAAVGLERLSQALPRRWRWLALVVPWLVPLTLWSEHRDAMDRSGHRDQETWSAAVLAAIDRDGGGRDRPKVVIAGDYLGYETLQYVRQIGPAEGGEPRRDLLVLTPLLPEDVMPDVRAFVARHTPPPLVRDQLLGARTAASLRDYLEGEGELESFEERSSIPRGLTVYVLGDAQRALLERSGSAVSPVAPGVFRVARAEGAAGAVP